MKWKKQRYTPKANTHRAGWKFWDLIDDDGNALAYIRYRPKHGYEPFAHHFDDRDAFLYKTFPTEKEAKDYVVAYFVTKRLEDYT